MMFSTDRYTSVSTVSRRGRALPAIGIALAAKVYQGQCEIKEF